MVPIWRDFAQDTDTWKTFLQCSTHPKLPRSRSSVQGFILTQHKPLNLQNDLEATPSTNTFKKQLVLDMKRRRGNAAECPHMSPSLAGVVRSDSVRQVISVHPLSSPCCLFRWGDAA